MVRSELLRLRGAGVHWQLVEGEVLALDEATQEYLALNRSGALLWELLAHGTTRDELVARLVSEYALEPARAAADVDRLLGELAERGLLADSPAPALDALASDSFAGLVGERFELTPPGGEPHELVLSECHEMPGGPGPGGRVPFSLIFHAPSGGLVPQQICALSHPQLGTLELFVVPVGPDERGMRYQVVFS